MTSKFLKSSLIHSISYDKYKLLINFKNGHSYLYYDVPFEVYEELSQTPSAGKFYNNRIKNKFSSKKIQ